MGNLLILIWIEVYYNKIFFKIGFIIIWYIKRKYICIIKKKKDIMFLICIDIFVFVYLYVF